MAKKYKIDFRIGNVRAYKIAEYQKKYSEKHGKKLSNADFMRMAIDTFLEQKDEIDIHIEEYEKKLIKILTGIDGKEIINKEEY